MPVVVVAKARPKGIDDGGPADDQPPRVLLKKGDKVLGEVPVKPGPDGSITVGTPSPRPADPPFEPEFFPGRVLASKFAAGRIEAYNPPAERYEFERNAKLLTEGEHIVVEAAAWTDVSVEGAASPVCLYGWLGAMKVKHAGAVIIISDELDERTDSIEVDKCISLDCYIASSRGLTANEVMEVSTTTEGAGNPTVEINDSPFVRGIFRSGDATVNGPVLDTQIQYSGTADVKLNGSFQTVHAVDNWTQPSDECTMHISGDVEALRLNAENGFSAEGEIGSATIRFNSADLAAARFVRAVHVIGARNAALNSAGGAMPIFTYDRNLGTDGLSLDGHWAYPKDPDGVPPATRNYLDSYAETCSHTPTAIVQTRARERVGLDDPPRATEAADPLTDSGNGVDARFQQRRDQIIKARDLADGRRREETAFPEYDVAPQDPGSILRELDDLNDARPAFEASEGFETFDDPGGAASGPALDPF